MNKTIDERINTTGVSPSRDEVFERKISAIDDRELINEPNLSLPSLEQNKVDKLPLSERILMCRRSPGTVMNRPLRRLIPATPNIAVVDKDLTIDQVASYLGKGVRTLHYWKSKNSKYYKKSFADLIVVREDGLLRFSKMRVEQFVKNNNLELNHE